MTTTVSSELSSIDLNIGNVPPTSLKSSNTAQTKKKRVWGKTCSVPGCQSRTGKCKTSFHSAPFDVAKRTRWLDLCKISHRKLQDKSVYICGLHFKPEDFSESKERSRLKRTALPSLNLPDDDTVQLLSERKKKKKCSCCGKFVCCFPLTPSGMSSNKDRSEDLPDNNDVAGEDAQSPWCDECKLRVEAAKSLLGTALDTPVDLEADFNDDSVHVQSAVNEQSPDRVDAGVQTECIDEIMSGAVETVETRKDIATQTEYTEETRQSGASEGASGACSGACKALLQALDKPEGATCKDMSVQTDGRGMLSILKTDRQLKAFTGVDFQMLEVLESSCEMVIKANPHVRGMMANSLCSLKDKIALTLCKLKLNLSFLCLGPICGVSDRTAYSYFISTLNILACALEVAKYWPEKEEILANIPDCFRKYSKTRMVLHCTEVPVEKPSCLQCRTHLYSHYKSCETVKVCVGITPCGMISFVSEVFGGRAADKAIVEASGILDKLLPLADAVMVDKGFIIEKECDERRIELIRPPFASSLHQMSQADTERNRDIARARVHVERAIQRMKVFQILHSTLPWSLVPFMDRIMTVVVGLVNLSPPILSDDSVVGKPCRQRKKGPKNRQKK